MKLLRAGWCGQTPSGRFRRRHWTARLSDSGLRATAHSAKSPSISVDHRVSLGLAGERELDIELRSCRGHPVAIFQNNFDERATNSRLEGPETWPSLDSRDDPRSKVVPRRMEQLHFEMDRRMLPGDGACAQLRMGGLA